MYGAHAFYVTKCNFVIFGILLQCVDMKIAENKVKSEEKDKGIASKTCLLKPDDGPCRANVPMYFFDPESGNCSRFLWGGCQGNGNRFNTHSECTQSCLKDITRKGRPRWCALKFDYGYCFGALKRYYYDHMWQVCKQRIFSGCGGNRNNFYSLEQCEAVCRFGVGKIVTTKKVGSGKAKKVVIINPVGAKTRRGATTITKKAK